MSDVQHYSGGGLTPSRPARQAARVISRNSLSAQVRVSKVDAETDVAVAKVENTTMAYGTAMSAVVRIAQAQRQLEQVAPEASSRLAFLADDHALGMADLMADLRRDLRRA